MASPESQSANQFHDRLDMKLQTVEHLSNECGSESIDTANGSIGKKTYCDADCPTLKADLAAGTAGKYRLLA